MSRFNAIATLCLLGLVASAPTENRKRASSNAKMGISWAIQEKDAAPVAQFFTSGSSVSWWFDWNKNWNQGLLTSSGVTISGQFVPMLYDTSFFNNSDPLETGWTDIMGYNEPDLYSSAGVSTPIDPGVAAAAWKTQVTKIRAENSAAKIHSPAVAYDTAWLQSFFAAICPGESAANAWGSCTYKPDYLSIHVYTADSASFESQVTTYHTDFGLPVVVSEFACYDFNAKTSPTAAEVSAFMTSTTAWLDEQDWVVKYAWFGAARSSDNLHGVAETNRLLDNSGALTALGKQYMAGGSA